MPVRKTKVHLGFCQLIDAATCCLLAWGILDGFLERALGIQQQGHLNIFGVVFL